VFDEHFAVGGHHVGVTTDQLARRRVTGRTDPHPGELVDPAAFTTTQRGLE
jgi:hypothetical protein